MPTAQVKRYYSVKEAAQLLGVSTNTIYTYLDTGKLKGRRIGRGRFKIPSKELQPFVDFEQTETPQLSSPEIEKVEVVSTPSVVVGSTHNTGPQKPSTENKKNLESVSIVENNPIQDASVEVTDILLKTPEEVNKNSIVALAKDNVLWKLFEALVLMGLGLVYIFTGNKIFTFSGEFVQESGEALRLVMPFALLVSGTITLFDSLFERKLRQYDALIHILNITVLSYFSYVTFVSGEFGMFILVSGLSFLTAANLLRGVTHTTSFFDSFTKYTALSVLLGGALILVNPTYFPLPYLTSLIAAHKGVFAVVWFGVVVLPALFLLTNAGKNSRAFVSVFYFLSGIMTLIYATQLGIQEKWDVSYITYLMSIFGFFLSWWNYSHHELFEKKMFSISFSFIWVGVAILIGLFVVSEVSGNLKKDKAELTLSNLNESKTDFQGIINSTHSLLIGYAGNSDLVTLIENGEEELLVQRGKDIFDKSDFSGRVIILDSNGKASAVYPREPKLQGADLSNADYFKVTKANFKGIDSNLVIGLNGEKTIVATEPVFKNNEFIGAIALGLDLEKLSLETQSSFPRDYKVHVVDENGVYVFGSSLDEIGYKKEESFYTTPEVDQNSGNKYKIYQTTLISPPYKYFLHAPPPALDGEGIYINILLSVFIVVNATFSIFAGAVIASKKDTETHVGIAMPLYAASPAAVGAVLK